MRRTFWICGLVLALALGFVAVSPAHAATISSISFACDSFSISGTSTAPIITVQVNTIGSAVTPITTGAFPVTGGTFSGSVSFTPQLAGTVLEYIAFENGIAFVDRTSVCGQPANPAPPPANTDGRLNIDTALPPFVLYCQSGGIAAWTINMVRGAAYEGRGSLAFVAYGSQIANALALATSSGQNVRIIGNYGVSLYALSSYELQAHWEGQGNPYDFIFAPNRCGVNFVVGAPVIVVKNDPPPSGPSYGPPTSWTGWSGHGQIYVVQPGDNLYRIALRFGVPLPVLAAANGIYNYNYIYAGEILHIP